MAQEMKYICWYDDYDRKLAKLSDQELGRLLRACMKYHMTGEMQELAGREAVAYDFIVTDIDNAGRSYAEKCATNAENARKGAAARWGDQGNADRYSKNAENGERHFGNAENAQKEEQEQENRKKEQEKKESERENAADAASPTPKKQTRFVPPTVEEVAAYCKERGNKVDASRFCDFYTAKGWKVGNTPMKDWKAAVRNWEHTDKQTAQPPGGSSFDRDEFFEAAVAASMDRHRKGGLA